MKKLVSLVLALIMVLSMASFAGAEEIVALKFSGKRAAIIAVFPVDNGHIGSQISCAGIQQGGQIMLNSGQILASLPPLPK